MKQVLKYDLYGDCRYGLYLPKGSTFAHFGEQDGRLKVWMVVTEKGSEPEVEWRFENYPTGLASIPSNRIFMATCQKDDGTVWHLFLVMEHATEATP